MIEQYAPLRGAETDEDFKTSTQDLDGILGVGLQWIMDEMGEAAFTKINHPQVQHYVWTWPGNATPKSKCGGSKYLTFKRREWRSWTYSFGRTLGMASQREGSLR